MQLSKSIAACEKIGIEDTVAPGRSLSIVTAIRLVVKRKIAPPGQLRILDMLFIISSRGWCGGTENTRAHSEIQANTFSFL